MEREKEAALMKRVVTYTRADGTKVRQYLRRKRKDQKGKDGQQAER